MNVKNRNFMYMLMRVDKTLDDNRRIWEVEQRMQLLKSELRERVDVLQELFQTKDKLLVPHKKIRATRMEEFADKILQLAGFLHELSINDGDSKNALYTHLTRTDLIYNSIQDARIKAQLIIDKAIERESELEAFTNGALVLKEAMDKVDSFRDNGLMPFQHRNHLRDTNADIKRHIKETKAFLSHRLDRVMSFFAHRESSFYTTYKKNRIVPSTKATRSVATISPTPEETTRPLDKVMAMFKN